MNNLQPHLLPLTGRHLIEASAGTGKTFNITRIFLRLLLERQLQVQQILVMTFTKAATEEIRGRIEQTLRQALKDLPTWQGDSDPYFRHLASLGTSQQLKDRIQHGLLHLDEAAIFTIHGFCKRVLSEQAFSSGVHFNVQMETDCRDIQLDAVRDFYRRKAINAEEYALIHDHWPTPEDFLAQLRQALTFNEGELEFISPAQVTQNIADLFTQARQDIQQHESLLSQTLISSKKGADKELRIQEWQALQHWLAGADAEVAMPAAFIDKRRYSRNKQKDEINQALASSHALKSAIASLPQQLHHANAMQLIAAALSEIKAQTRQQKQRQHVMDFDDLILTLAQALKNDHDDSLGQLLFSQYPVALVDEFQDTDPLQYGILRHIYFNRDDAALYLIGDPKQAIYAFRGGDVFAYLAARADANDHWQMDTNWRSSAAMIQAYNRLFYGHSLDKPEDAGVFGFGIPYLPVKPSPKAAATQLQDPATDAALVLTDFALDEAYKSGNAREQKFNGSGFRGEIARWCATEIARLLSESRINQQPIRPQDIAILVRDGTEAKDIKQALDAAGLASVYLSNRDNLLKSHEARQLHTVLRGILDLDDDRKFIAALSTPYFALDTKGLHQLSEDPGLWEHHQQQFHALRERWHRRGFMSMAMNLLKQGAQFSPMHYQRALTNVIHLFELLQHASQRHRAPHELLFWFEQQCLNDLLASEAELRLESDDDLIRIVTQHGSKGLEYPVVFVPFASRHKDPLRIGSRKHLVKAYHDDDYHPHLALGNHFDAEQRLAKESYAESVRLLYVAVTRAALRCYVCSTKFKQSEASPLGCTLKLNADDDLSAALATLAADSEGEILHLPQTTLVESHCHPAPSQAETGTLASVKFKGRIERDWWLSSFSALSRNIRHGGKSNKDRDNLDAHAGLKGSSTQLRFKLAKGAHAGNLLHDSLETLDFQQPDWPNSLRHPLAKFGSLGEEFEQQDLQQWLQQCLDTELQSGLSLSSLTMPQTLRESEFYFPMQQANMASLNTLLNQHRQDTGSERNEISLPAYTKLKGMMHGFVDLIFEHQGKYYVCDYKSTHLGDHFDAYNHAAIRANIEQNFYDLQYLIYATALHRHLKCTLPDYTVEQHFGGVYYLYLRGMSEHSPSPGSGVYFRALSSECLEQLDSIFAGGSHV